MELEKVKYYRAHILDHIAELGGLHEWPTLNYLGFEDAPNYLLAPVKWENKDINKPVEWMIYTKRNNYFEHTGYTSDIKNYIGQSEEISVLPLHRFSNLRVTLANMGDLDPVYDPRWPDGTEVDEIWEKYQYGPYPESVWRNR